MSILNPFIILNDQYIRVNGVGFIGKIDVTINHGLVHSSKVYWFHVVVDGQTVKIDGNTFEDVEILRYKLLKECDV
jgi:hypothetical protein